MRNPTIAKVILPAVVNKMFDYLCPAGETVLPGMRVAVDFRGRKSLGLVIETAGESSFKNLKPVLSVLDERPVLDEGHFEFAARLSQLYPYAPGEFLLMMLPPFLKIPKKNILSCPNTDKTCTTTAQGLSGLSQKIFIKADTFRQRYCLWRSRVEEALHQGSVLICFAQVSHLNDARCLIEKDFQGKVAVIHSKMKSKEFFAAWQASRGKALILGTRVSLFYYPCDLRLLIIEQEHSCHYFQEEKPYHHLFDAASLLCDIRKNDFLISSDYPSLGVYNLAKQSSFETLEHASAPKPIQVVSCDGGSKHGLLNPVVKEILDNAFASGRRIVILWNKKGFTRGVSCSHCKEAYHCQHCSGFLEMLAAGDQALCPYCQRMIALPKICPKCRNGYFRGGGWGIERLEASIRNMFPAAKVDNWLGRSSRSQCVLATSGILSTLYRGDEFDQGIVLDADNAVMRIDYDATFNAFLYFKQLSILFREKLYLFTHNPKYYLYEYINSSWQDFYDKELELRKALRLPPYGLLVSFTLRSSSENYLLKSSQKLYNVLRESFADTYGPFKVEPFKVRDYYRYSLITKADKTLENRKIVQTIISGIRLSKTHLTVIMQ